MKLSDIKLNSKNPRFIKDDKFLKLIQSIKEFPKMMKLRPIIVDNNNIILGGNMRFRALQELGYEEIPDEWIKKSDNLTEDEYKRFIIADNISFGNWDYELLNEDWDIELLEDWGLDLSDISDVDYGNKNINDIEEVSSFSESVNFVIKCDSIEQLEQLQTKINISGKQISYKDFLIKAGL